MITRVAKGQATGQQYFKRYKHQPRLPLISFCLCSLTTLSAACPPSMSSKKMLPSSEFIAARARLKYSTSSCLLEPSIIKQCGMQHQNASTRAYHNLQNMRKKWYLELRRNILKFSAQMTSAGVRICCCSCSCWAGFCC